MKIAVTCGPTSQLFLDAIERLLREGGHEVQRFTVSNPHRTLVEMRAWGAQAQWHEWADSHAAVFADRCRMGDPLTVPLVVRCHRHEADTPLPKKIEDMGSARLVFTAAHIARRAGVTDYTLIASIVDFEKFPLVSTREANAPVKMAVVGYLNGRKQPGLACAVDDEMPTGATLTFIGEEQGEHWKRYVTRRGATVRPWTNDVSAVWREHQVCLSASMDEGCPYNVIEAMASGAVPLVHHYEGAEEQFPMECLWWNVGWAAYTLTEQLAREPSYWRWWAMERYSIEANREKVLGLFR